MSESNYTLRQIQVALNDCSVDEKFSEYPWTDQLLVKVILIEGDYTWCLVSVDTTELNTFETLKIRKRAATVLGIPYLNIWIHYTHTHSAWLGYPQLDVMRFSDSILSAVKAAKETAPEPINAISLISVNTDNKYTINRRAYIEDVGSFSMYQCAGCQDDGRTINAAEGIKDMLRLWGAKEDGIHDIREVNLDGEVDGMLQLVLFAFGSSPIAGIVRFNAHPVVLSNNFYKPHFSRDYCGVLCDSLSEMWNCPILFMQGPAGNQRIRHSNNSLQECEQLGKNLAKELEPEKNTPNYESLDSLVMTSKILQCSIQDYIALNENEYDAHIKKLEEEIKKLEVGNGYLKELKLLADESEMLKMLKINISELGLVNEQDIVNGYREMEVSAVKFGKLILCVANNELANFFSLKLYDYFNSEGLIVGAYTNGCDGYVLEPWDFENGGYEQWESLIKPENSTEILAAAKEIISTLKSYRTAKII